MKITLIIRKKGNDLIVENKLGLILAVISEGTIVFKVSDLTFNELDRINFICQDFLFLIENVIEYV